MLLSLAPGTVFEALKYGLPASIFFFKFLEWWYGADNPRRRRGAGTNTAAGGGSAGTGANGEEASYSTLDPPAPLLPDLKTGILSNTIQDSLPAYKLPHIFALSAQLYDKISSATETDDHIKPKLIAPNPNTTTQGKGEKRHLIHNSCPLCGALPINNPAVYPTGYVFCYTCAFNWVDTNGRCPLTNVVLPEGKESLRKVLG